MALKVEVASGEDAITELVTFADRVYEYRSARWAAFVPFQVPILTGDSPFSEGREFHPLVARRSGEILARAVAVVDQRYIDHWNEPLGHVVMFEALPDAQEAAPAVLHQACEWLSEKGIRAARAGFGINEFPFAIDEYELLPPTLVRQNPPYYHRMLKDAGFESEKGWVDYKIEVTPELVETWKGYLAKAEANGFEIIPLGEVADDRRLSDYTETWNDAFAHHWGNTPITTDESASFFEILEPFGVMELSVITYRDGEPVGVVFVASEMTAFATLASGRELDDSEKLNFLGIGVRESARRQGVNLAMAASAYLKLARQRAKYVSYTMVVDDNWPSRRTAEKLGARVCANYLVYRHNFR
jgi:GNAT superfamily N-acetyltransferase